MTFFQLWHGPWGEDSAGPRGCCPSKAPSPSLLTYPGYIIPCLSRSPIASSISIGVAFSKGELHHLCVSTPRTEECGAGCEPWMCGLEYPPECVEGSSLRQMDGKREGEWGLLARGLWLHTFCGWAGISNSLVRNHLKRSTRLACEAHCLGKVGFHWPLRPLCAQLPALPVGQQWFIVLRIWIT